MSRTPYFFVERPCQNTGKYELQHPIIWNWDHTKRVTADLFPYNACYDLFSIVENETNDFPKMRGIHYGLPKDTCEEIKKSYDSCCYQTDDNNDKYCYSPKAYWFSYADMYIYCLEHPEIPDYEAMDLMAEDDENSNEKIMMPTPLKGLKDRVDAFLEVMDGWDWRDDYSQIRIVYWIE